MKTADLITSFLSNEMNPEQERQFLLSVAASDSLRLSLKSHVMLDRISANQLHRAEVPVPVREAIFAQMSASLAATASHDASQPASRPSAPGGRAPGGFLRKVGSHALVMALTASGFVAGYLTRSELTGADQVQVQSQVQQVPAATEEPPSGLQPEAATVRPSEPVAGIALPAAPKAEKAVARADRELVRSTSQSVSSRVQAVTPVRVGEGMAAPVGNPSSPLDPPGTPKNMPAASTTAAAGISKDSLEPKTLEPKTMPPSSVRIEPTIRTSTEGSQQIQPQQGD